MRSSANDLEENRADRSIESVEVALTWVKAHAYVLGLTSHPDEDLTKNRNVHVHCPAGAVPKVGFPIPVGQPSADLDSVTGWPKRRCCVHDRHDIYVFRPPSITYSRHDGRSFLEREGHWCG